MHAAGYIGVCVCVYTHDLTDFKLGTVVHLNMLQPASLGSVGQGFGFRVRVREPAPICISRKYHLVSSLALY